MAITSISPMTRGLDCKPLTSQLVLPGCYGKATRLMEPASAMPYITRIEVFNHYKLPDFSVDFASTNGKPFRHLILTGPNGSGKTTILTRLAGDVFSSIRGTSIRDQRAIAANMIPVHEQRLANPSEALPGQRKRFLEQSKAQLAAFAVVTTWAPNDPSPDGVGGRSCFG